jgi:hypothetical protein
MTQTRYLTNDADNQAEWDGDTMIVRSASRPARFVILTPDEIRALADFLAEVSK